ncbi:MAG TPA: hypothetical protein VI934_00400 [Candidatus Nanoarchaeia archaeon]|nr:hypothetical protein [Candidatus Nanoarchaeia archaeon]
MNGGEKMGMDGCCGPDGSYGQRSFLTRDEKAEMLKQYKDSLEKEVQAVSERIADLKKEK